MSTLFLIWVVLMAIQHMLRSIALWKATKGDFLHLSEPTTAPGGTPTTGPASGMLSTHAGWLLRVRHSAKILRDATLMLLVTTLTVTLLVYRSPLARPTPDSDQDMANEMWTPFVFTWILFSITLLQVVLHLIVEPMAKSRSRHAGYQYFGPGVYGGREEVAGKWLDPVFDLAKTILVIILVIVALTKASTMPHWHLP